MSTDPNPPIIPPARPAANQVNAQVVNKTLLTSELFLLELKPDAGVPKFTPGQYVAIGLPQEAADGKVKLLRRAYSISSTPDKQDALELYIALVKDGELTPKLIDLKVGDRLNVAPKITGHFTLEGIQPGKELVLVSTGTGLAPFMSMVRTASTWELASKIHIVHGVRYQSDLGFKDELEQLASSTGRLNYHPFCSREEPQSPIRKGHVHKVFTEGLISLNPDKQHIFLCGNPAMVEQTQRNLQEQGFVEHSKKSPGNLHVEKYW